MARFTAPQHHSSLSVAGVDFPVVNGIVEVPDELAGSIGPGSGYVRAPDAKPMPSAKKAEASPQSDAE